MKQTREPPELLWLNNLNVETRNHLKNSMNLKTKTSSNIKIRTMKKLIFTISILTFTALSTFAQTEATTKDSKKVILNDDGTWKYAETTTAETTIILDCAELITTETDKMTGKTTTYSKETLIISEDGGKSGFGIFIMDISGSLVFSIQAVGAGSCIDDDNKMNVLFRDGTRLELVNNGKFNCDGEFTLYFGGSFGKNKELETFRNKEVETMRIWTSKSYVEKDFSSDQSKELMKTFDCLLNQ